MAKLTKDDLKKTIPEYLGITGSTTEVTLRLEQDKRVSDLLDELFREADTSYRKNSNGLTYTYLIDALCAGPTALTLEKIQNDRDDLIKNFHREYDEIESDYTEKSGFKPDLFLKAVSYDTDKDGFDRKAFFFRFWRSPLKKVLAYRETTVGTPDGDAQAKKILKTLFSTHLEETTWPMLLEETPEHLMEQRDAIEKEQKKRAAEHEKDLAQLPRMTLSEIWAYKSGYFWSPDMAVDFTGLSANDIYTYLSASPKARNFLTRYIRNPKRDQMKPAGVSGWAPEEEPLDPEFFQAIGGLTLAQLKDNQNRLADDLKARNDMRFLGVNPDMLFQDFARERFYSSVYGKPDEKAALQALLQTKKAQPDSKAIQSVRNKKCSEILAERDRIMDGILTRRGLRWGSWLGSAALSSMLFFGFLTGQKTETKPEPAPKKAPVQQVTKPTPKTAPKSAIANTQRPEQKTDPKSIVDPNSQPTLKDNDGDVHVQLRPLILPNRPVYLEWETFRDQDLKTPDKTLPSQLLTSLYWSVLDRIEKSGRTCAEFLDSTVVAQSMRIGVSVVLTSGPKGHESPQFYFNNKQKIAGKDAKSAMVQDLINYARNLGAVLTDLPIDPGNKAEVQALALRAIGPGIGWSQDQQQIYQACHRQETHQAYQAISTTARQILKERHIGSNNPEGITIAVLEATARYRQDHPDYQAFSLIALDTAREISGGRDNLRFQDRSGQSR